MPKYIIDDVDRNSSDEDDFDKENSDEENTNE